MKKSVALLMSIVGLLLINGMQTSQAELLTIAYPTIEDADFYIDVPDDWELEQAEEAGGYFHVTGPTGAMFSFRTIPVEDEEEAIEELENSINAAVEFLAENYYDLQLGDPVDDTISGCEGFYATGTGVDDEYDEDVVFGMSWYILPSSAIAEIWFVALRDDDEGLNQARTIIRSFTTP